MNKFYTKAIAVSMLFTGLSFAADDITDKKQTTEKESIFTEPTFKQGTSRRFSSSSQRKDLKEFVSGPDAASLFSLSTANFEKKYQASYRATWTDKFKRSARSTTPLNFVSTISNETIFSFRKGKFNKVTMMIYNKGDQAALNKAQFQTVQQKAIKAITTLTGAEPKYKPNAGLVQNHLHWWLMPNYLIKLEANYTDAKKYFSGEYIRLSFVPVIKGMNAVNIDKANSNVLTSQELLTMVNKDKDGAVYLSGVPMVDQGRKGYCACAATARILNYYGRDIDQHDIAKLALSSAMGTDPEDLKKALEKISAKLRLNVTTVVKCYLNTENDIKRFLSKLKSAYKRHNYNFNARRLVSKEIKEVFASMAAKDSRYRTFKKGIIRSINLGRPLAWALMLGIVPEPDVPQASGGHMRLIIGYNEKTDEIYYSDTWGAGHEKKTMDMRTAFWVSCALWEIRPR